MFAVDRDGDMVHETSWPVVRIDDYCGEYAANNHMKQWNGGVEN